MFKNTRTNQTMAELKVFPAEDERSARMRLSAAGWSIPGDAFFDEDRKVFTMDEPKTAAVSEDGDDDDGE
jgi:hypothetical protein